MAQERLQAYAELSAPRLCLDLRADFHTGHLKHAVHVMRLASLKSRFSTLPKRGVPFLVVCDGDELEQVAHVFVPPERWAIVGILGIDAVSAPESTHPCFPISRKAFQTWAEAHGLWTSAHDPHLLFSPAKIVERALQRWDGPFDASILDVGCGAGRDVTFLLAEGRRKGQAWKVTALDRWRAALDRARLLLEDNQLTNGPGAHAEALLPVTILENGQLQLDQQTFSLVDAPLPRETYQLILFVRFWHMPLLQNLPTRTAPGTMVVLSHFVHEPHKITVPQYGTFVPYDSPPPSARIQPNDIDTLLNVWNQSQRWIQVDNRIEPVEDGRPVQSVLLQRVL